MIVIDLPRMSRRVTVFVQLRTDPTSTAPTGALHFISEKVSLKSPISATVCVMNLSLVIEPSAPLNSQDSPRQTYGCRHRNPNNCASNSMENVCAFVTVDNICLKPPAGWPKQYKTLQKQ